MRLAKKNNQSNYIVPALERGLAVLEYMSRDGRSVTVAELTREMDLPRASVFRILCTFQMKGFVEADASGKAYRLGPGVLRLGYQFLATRDIVQVSRIEIESLAARTGISAHLAVRDGRDIVYLVHSPGDSNFVSNLGVGDRLPAHATPMGLLLLSALSRAELLSLYKDQALESLTGQTPRSQRALFRAVAAAAEAGYVVSHGTVHPGGKSIAGPVRNAAGAIIAAIDISGPDQAFKNHEIETRYLKDVLRAAHAISSRLGFSNKTSI